MKKITKLLLGGVLVILPLALASQVKADWHQDNIGWWYSTNNGSYYKDTLAYIDNNFYRFDERGYMITGWYLEEYRATSGWLFKGWSYFDPVSGARLKGWQQIDGKWYYFVDYTIHNYALKGFNNIDGKEYYFDPVNADMKTGWISRQSDVKKWYYYDPESGERLLGWQDIDGKKYYLTSEGAYCGYTYTIDGKEYYFDPVTCELITGWFEYNGTKRYADPNDGGALALNKTLIIDGVSYSFSDSGALITNEP